MTRPVTGRGPLRRRLAVALAAVLVLAAACTRATAPPAAAPSPATRGSSGPAAVPSATPNPLCRHPQADVTAPPTSSAKLPPAVAAVADQVEQARGLRFTRPVVPEAVSQTRIGSLLTSSLDRSYPRSMMDGRGRAWAAIGVVPAGTDLRQAIGEFASTQIIGFYDTATHQLVFSGSNDPTPYERLTLAHELTHALDDQRFDLHRLDLLEAACRDERLAAFVALAEGDAVVTSLRWAQATLGGDEQSDLQRQAANFQGPPASVPTFVQALLTSPYPTGQAFVQALLARGGAAAVNAAFRNPPVSTEQVLHPERYPGDRPQVVAVPDLAEKLGGDWREVDAFDVGEEWLRLMLETNLPDTTAEPAAAGWDGGRYRAWSSGDRTVVLMQTVWDSAGDAEQFAAAVRAWAGSRPVIVRVTGPAASVRFGSDGAALRALEAAAG